MPSFGALSRRSCSRLQYILFFSHIDSGEKDYIIELIDVPFTHWSHPGFDRPQQFRATKENGIMICRQPNSDRLEQKELIHSSIQLQISIYTICFVIFRLPVCWNICKRKLATKSLQRKTIPSCAILGVVWGPEVSHTLLRLTITLAVGLLTTLRVWGQGSGDSDARWGARSPRYHPFSTIAGPT